MRVRQSSNFNVQDRCPGSDRVQKRGIQPPLRTPAEMAKHFTGFNDIPLEDNKFDIRFTTGGIFISESLRTTMSSTNAIAVVEENLDEIELKVPPGNHCSSLLGSHPTRTLA
ncbi:hypothetical protein FQR65_LT17890 [Abscondita terminalis]|nr:hypothetical protein FQR65_LT17890 [Abscondita terminalis]